LFLHPSKGLRSLSVQEKLIGVKNYKFWKRHVEIALATKKKLEFLQVTISRPSDDVIKVEMWDTCNCVIVA